MVRRVLIIEEGGQGRVGILFLSGEFSTRSDLHIDFVKGNRDRLLVEQIIGA